MALGGWMSGLVFDLTGSHQAAFRACCGMYCTPGSFYGWSCAWAAAWPRPERRFADNCRLWLSEMTGGAAVPMAVRSNQDCVAMSLSAVEQAIESLVVVIADSNAYTRKLTRSMLMQAKSIYEAGDGVAALDTVRSVAPDVLIVNWELPGMDGREVVRTVRAPGVFPKPNLPIIMLSEMGRRSQVQEALRLGVHEFLIKPISPKILQQRLLSIVMHPRPMVRAGQYYIPLPRRPVEMNEWLQVV
jgi:two-component system chemotaxis response regulator CheY